MLNFRLYGLSVREGRVTVMRQERVGRNSLENAVFKKALLASLVCHAVLFVTAPVLLPDVLRRQEASAVKVSIAPPSPPVVTPVPVATVQPPKIRPPVRVDKRVPVPAQKTPMPEVRAGLSDSLAKPGTARDSAPAVAVGNSSFSAVNPDDANKPPPAPLSEDPESVAELAADAPAQCPLPPSLELTNDALNAGLTNAEVVIEVAIASTGAIQKAQLKVGTGFEIDKIAMRAALKLKCTPAVLAGRPVAVTGKKLVWKVMYD